MKIIVAGSRDVEEEKVIEILNKYGVAIEVILGKCAVLSNEDVEIVTGGARGVDTFAHKWAIEKGYKTKVFEANWEKYGKSAGMIKEMAEYADGLIAIWDGESRGTKNMIEMMSGLGKTVAIERVAP